MNRSVSICIVLVTIVVSTAASLSPQQIHISLGETNGSMVVTFATLNSNSTDGVSSVVEYEQTSADGPSESVPGHISTYTEGGWIGLIHRATLSGLKVGSGYRYRCGVTSAGVQSWSDWFPIEYFRTVAGSRNVTFAVVADLDGREAAGLQTINALVKAATSSSIDAVLHAGDIAYIKGADTEGIYDSFFQSMQGAAAVVPYHVGVGNQEHWNEFAGYDARFSMPGPGNNSNMWHSLDMGPMHLLFISTEHSYEQGSPQRAFLESDLAGVDRIVTPWVMVLLHRPLYCSTNDYYDCRIAAPKKLRPALEPLFLQHGVDVVMAGHVHNYERTAPVINGSIAEKGGIVHVTCGNAGDIEGMTHGWLKPRPPYSLVQSTELGWTRWVATPEVLQLELVASGNGTVLDSYTWNRAAAE